MHPRQISALKPQKATRLWEFRSLLWVFRSLGNDKARQVPGFASYAVNFSAYPMKPRPNKVTHTMAKATSPTIQ
jgi:hypothetical protein